MTRIGFGIMIAVSIALTSATLTAADDPALIKATFFSHTNDEDKDHDTCVNVTVSSSDGSSLIAHANQRDCSPNDGTQYKDNSDHQFDLEIDAAGVAKSASKGYKVHVCQTTNGGAGHDTWRWSGRVLLTFSDRTNLVATSGNVELKNNDSCTDFAAP